MLEVINIVDDSAFALDFLGFTMFALLIPIVTVCQCEPSPKGRFTVNSGEHVSSVQFTPIWIFLS